MCVQDSAARFTHMLPPAALAGSALRGSGAASGPHSRSGSGVAEADVPEAPFRWGASASWQGQDEERASWQTAADAPQTPPSAPAVTPRGKPAQPPPALWRSGSIGRRLPAGGGAAEAGGRMSGRDPDTTAAGRQETLLPALPPALPPSPQSSAGSPPQDARSDGGRSSRLKRRHAEAATDGAPPTGGAARAASPAARICSRSTISKAARNSSRDSGSRSSSPAKPAVVRRFAAHHAGGSVADARQDSSLMLQPARAARRRSPTPERWPVVFGAAAGASLTSRQDACDRPSGQQHALLQPLQMSSVAPDRRSVPATAVRHGGSGMTRGSGGSRQSITIDATSEVLRAGGRLRAASGERGRDRRQRSASVEDDLDEVTAILKQLRHR